ncbi:hypothetical protein [Oceanobacillus massiliensis]|uniref:hypothetical protein n=1 Tax=Oceanobacillus massiliensis TaxID=1465765 RepID=UPI0030184943
MGLFIYLPVTTDSFSAYTDDKSETIEDMKEQATIQLNQLLHKNKKHRKLDAERTELIAFLEEEINREKPRVLLLEGALISLSKTPSEPVYEYEFTEIISTMWRLVEMISGK